MKHQHKLSSATMAHLNELLDEALKQTFPASDPIAINIELDQWNAELVSRLPVGCESLVSALAHSQLARVAGRCVS